MSKDDDLIADMLMGADAAMPEPRQVAKVVRLTAKPDTREDPDILAQLAAIKEILTRILELVKRLALNGISGERRSAGFSVTVTERDENERISKVTVH